MDLLGQSLVSFILFGFLPGALLAIYCTRPSQRDMMLFGLMCGAVGLAGAYSITGYAGSMELHSLRGPVTQTIGSVLAAAAMLLIFDKLRLR